MASEIRVDKITSLSGVGTITPSSSGIDITGITTVATLKATTGIVTTLTATTGIVTTLTANTVTSLGAISGTTGTFSGDVSIADKIVHTGDTDTAIRFSGDDTIKLETGGSERLRVDSTGQTIASGTLFADADLFMIDKLRHTGDTDTAIRFPSADTITAETGGTERLRVTSEGKLGINRTSPNTIIHALGNSTVGTSVTCLLQADATANATSTLEFYARDNSNNNEICRVRAASGGAETVSLQFHTADTERARIDSSGRVLIGGTSNPTGESTRTLNLVATSASEAALVLSRSNSLGGSTAGQTIRLQTNGDLNFTVHNVGEKVRFPAAGGITFNGDTAAANALDDYEEGTWTPDVRFSNHLGEANQLSYHSRSGYYTKVGNTVTISGFFNTSSLNGKTGNFYMFGLPHAPLSSTNPLITIIGDGFNFGSNEFGTTFLLIEGGNNRAVGGWQRETGWSYMTNSNITSGGMYFSGFYYV